MIEGKPVEIGGKRYILPPLGLDGLKLLAEVRPNLADMSEPDQIENNLRVVHAALKRNYPEMTFDDMREAIHAFEISELADILPSLMERSGFQKLGESSRGSKKKKA